MKKCPYCGEEIQDLAKKCRFCGEWIDQKSESKETINTKGKQFEEPMKISGDEFLELPEIKNRNPKRGASGYAWRRFFARQFDIGLYITIVGTILYVFSGGDLEIVNGAIEIVNKGHVFEGGKLFFLLFFSYIAVEPILLNAFGTTLGKKIMGIRVADFTGTTLTYTDGLRRTALVYLGGLGLGFPIVSQIVMLTQMGNMTSKGKGYSPSYDYKRYKVTYKEISIFNYAIIFAIIFFYFV